jgi:hypothetical protein
VRALAIVGAITEVVQHTFYSAGIDALPAFSRSWKRRRPNRTWQGRDSNPRSRCAPAQSGAATARPSCVAACDIRTS